MTALTSSFIQTVLSKVGCGYVYASQGEKMTPVLLKALVETFGKKHYYFTGYSAEIWYDQESYDCSGLVVRPLINLGLIEDDYTAAGLYRICIPLTKGDLQPGDLVFRGSTSISHVGVYLGSGRIVHAKGTKYGVVEDVLDSSFNLYGRLICLDPVRDFQKRYELEVDGVAGPITKGKMKEVYDFLRPYVEEVAVPSFNTYAVRKYGTASYVLVDPLKLSSALVRGTASTISKQYRHFASGMFNDKNSGWPQEGRLYCLLVVDGKKIFAPQSQDQTRKGTFVVYQDGTTQITTLRDIADVSNIKLAFQGYNMNYDANGKKDLSLPLSEKLLSSVLAEGFLSDVVRSAHRIAYGICGKQIAICSQNSDAIGIRATMRAIGCKDSKGDTLAIGVDGGAPSSLVVNSAVVGNGGGEIRHAIYWN